MSAPRPAQAGRPPRGSRKVAEPHLLEKAKAGSTTLAYVLHHYNWSESSLILDLFTRERGRIAVAAKGAKKPHSQWRALLLPFHPLRVIFPASTKAEAPDVQTLRGAEWVGGSAWLQGTALFSGYYLNELLMKLLARQDPHPQLFDAYDQTLPHLASSDDGAVQAALRAFEINLLRHTGVLPELHRQTQTQQPLLPAERYTLHGEAGLCAAQRDDSALSGAQWLALQAALESGAAQALHAACAQARQPLRGVLRELLHYHLGTRSLRSRQALADVQRLLDHS